MAAAKVANPEQSFESALKVRFPAYSRGVDLDWLNKNDIEKVWEAYLKNGS